VVLSSEPIECRLLIDSPRGGAWNMAVDEALLESVAKTKTPTLRFYQWAEPTLSLGYFQRYDERESHPPSRDCPVVRRSTGGGAILHDRELTYCLVWPAGAARSRARDGRSDATWLYRAVHQSLQNVLRGQGIESELLQRPPVAAGRQPLLCFQRRAECDMVIDNCKILGSAQRRRRGAVLQHGSLLLAATTKAPELSGLAEITGQPLDPTTLVAAWCRQLEETLGLALQPGVLDGYESQSAEELSQSKYGHQDWTRRR
jgi:lipoate-protein ligase A